MKQAGLGLLVVAVLACGACNRAGQHEASYAAAPAQDAIKREQAASEQADDALGAMLAYEHDATIALPAERIPEDWFANQVAFADRTDGSE